MKRFLVSMAAMAVLALVSISANAKPAGGSSKGGSSGGSKGGSITKGGLTTKGGGIAKKDAKVEINKNAKIKDNNVTKTKTPDFKKDKVVDGKKFEKLKDMKSKDYVKKFGGDYKKPFCYKTGKCIDFHGHCHQGFGCNFWSHRCYCPNYGCYLYYDHGCCDWFYWCEPYGCYYPTHFVPCGVYSFEVIVVQ